MASLNEKPSLNPSRVKNDNIPPSSLDLFNALEKILWFWPDLFIQSALNDEALLDRLNLSKAVRLTGSREGLVTFRTTPRLGTLLAEKLLPNAGTDQLGEDAFAEFVNMFCGYLMCKLREKDKISFRHFLPQDLPRAQWPSLKPDSVLVVAVQDNLLEIRLWMAPGQPPAGKG